MLSSSDFVVAAKFTILHHKLKKEMFIFSGIRDLHRVL